MCIDSQNKYLQKLEIINDIFHNIEKISYF